MNAILVTVCVNCMLWFQAQGPVNGASPPTSGNYTMGETPARELLRREVSLRDGDWFLVLRERRITHAQPGPARDIQSTFRLFELTKEPIHTGDADLRKPQAVWRVGGQVLTGIADPGHRWDVETDRDSNTAYLVHGTNQVFGIHVVDLAAEADDVHIDAEGQLHGGKPPTLIVPDRRLIERMRRGAIGHIRIRVRDRQLTVFVQAATGAQQEFVYSLSTGEWREAVRAAKE